MTIYNENKNTKSQEEIKLLIAKAINNISYQTDKTYFFINSNKGQAIILNKKIELDTYKDIWNLKDENNNLIVQLQSKITLENKEGFGRFIRIVDYTTPSEAPRYIKLPNKKSLVDKNDIVMIRYGSQSAGRVVRGIEGFIANNMFKIIINIQSNDYFKH